MKPIARRSIARRGAAVLAVRHLRAADRPRRGRRPRPSRSALHRSSPRSARASSSRQPYSGSGDHRSRDRHRQRPATSVRPFTSLAEPGPSALVIHPGHVERRPRALPATDGAFRGRPSPTGRSRRVPTFTSPTPTIVSPGSRASGKFVNDPLDRGERRIRSRPCSDYGEQAIPKAAAFFGITETKRDRLLHLPQPEPVPDRLWASAETIGGQAESQFRTCFALVAPDRSGYGSTVVPHELTHIVFNDVTDNPYHSPPRWLNEGLAVYLSEGYGSDDRGLVSRAVKSGTLVPLAALAGYFALDSARIFLSYAEAVSAVDFMVRKYGKAAIQKLVASLRHGRDRRRGVHGRPRRRHRGLRQGLAGRQRCHRLPNVRPAAGTDRAGTAGLERLHGNGAAHADPRPRPRVPVPGPRTVAENPHGRFRLRLPTSWPGSIALGGLRPARSRRPPVHANAARGSGHRTGRPPRGFA